MEHLSETAGISEPPEIQADTSKQIFELPDDSGIRKNIFDLPDDSGIRTSDTLLPDDSGELPQAANLDCEGAISQFSDINDMKQQMDMTYQEIKAEKPPHSPNLSKWFDNGESVQIEQTDQGSVWTYIDRDGREVPYIEGYPQFPPEAKHPLIPDLSIGEIYRRPKRGQTTIPGTFRGRIWPDRDSRGIYSPPRFGQREYTVDQGGLAPGVYSFWWTQQIQGGRIMLISKFSGTDVDQEIEVYGELNDIEFPEQLCDFLRKYNGGETPKTTFSCGSISSNLCAFYGAGNVKYSFSSEKPISQNGMRYLPIALDSFGNKIVIPATGQISFWNHETDSIALLDKNLRDFIQACKSEKINPASQKTIQEREQDLIRRGKGHVITDALRALWQAEIDKYDALHQEEVYF